MILNNVQTVNSNETINIKINGGKIAEISSLPIAADVL